jgi:hypothetical protein
MQELDDILESLHRTEAAVRAPTLQAGPEDEITGIVDAVELQTLVSNAEASANYLKRVVEAAQILFQDPASTKDALNMAIDEVQSAEKIAFQDIETTNLIQEPWNNDQLTKINEISDIVEDAVGKKIEMMEKRTKQDATAASPATAPVHIPLDSDLTPETSKFVQLIQLTLGQSNSWLKTMTTTEADAVRLIELMHSSVVFCTLASIQATEELDKWSKKSKSQSQTTQLELQNRYYKNANLNLEIIVSRSKKIIKRLEEKFPILKKEVEPFEAAPEDAEVDDALKDDEPAAPSSPSPSEGNASSIGDIPDLLDGGSKPERSPTPLLPKAPDVPEMQAKSKEEEPVDAVEEKTELDENDETLESLKATEALNQAEAAAVEQEAKAAAELRQDQAAAAGAEPYERHAREWTVLFDKAVHEIYANCELYFKLKSTEEKLQTTQRMRLGYERIQHNATESSAKINEFRVYIGGHVRRGVLLDKLHKEASEFEALYDTATKLFNDIVKARYNNILALQEALEVKQQYEQQFKACFDASVAYEQKHKTDQDTITVIRNTLLNGATPAQRKVFDTQLTDIKQRIEPWSYDLKEVTDKWNACRDYIKELPLTDQVSANQEVLTELQRLSSEWDRFTVQIEQVSAELHNPAKPVAPAAPTASIPQAQQQPTLVGLMTAARNTTNNFKTFVARADTQLLAWQSLLLYDNKTRIEEMETLRKELSQLRNTAKHDIDVVFNFIEKSVLNDTTKTQATTNITTTFEIFDTTEIKYKQFDVLLEKQLAQEISHHTAQVKTERSHSEQPDEPAPKFVPVPEPVPVPINEPRIQDPNYLFDSDQPSRYQDPPARHAHSQPARHQDHQAHHAHDTQARLTHADFALAIITLAQNIVRLALPPSPAPAWPAKTSPASTQNAQNAKISAGLRLLCTRLAHIARLANFPDNYALAALRCAAVLRAPLIAYALAPPPANFAVRAAAAPLPHPNVDALRAALAPAALAPLLRLAEAAAAPPRSMHASHSHESYAFRHSTLDRSDQNLHPSYYNHRNGPQLSEYEKEWPNRGNMQST